MTAPRITFGRPVLNTQSAVKTYAIRVNGVECGLIICNLRFWNCRPGPWSVAMDDPRYEKLVGDYECKLGEIKQHLRERLANA